MKTNTKNYQAAIELRKNLKKQNYKLENQSGTFTNEEYTKILDLIEGNKKVLAQLDEEYFSKLTLTPVSFFIGYRMYYREVVKIGKFYYNDGEKMTKSNGYRSVEEIEEITEKMKEDMISDSYYY